MYRIDDPSASNTLPTPEAALTEGYWTEGNPGAGTPATLERASWFNMIQEELRAIVVAGGLTPSKTTYNQILLALRSAGVFQTPAQFDNSTKAATMAAVRNELLGLGNSVYNAVFGATLAATGSQLLPSGYIRKWGQVALTTSGASVPVTFAAAFPTACYGVNMTPVSAASAPCNLSGSPTAAGFNASQSFTGGSTTYNWEAWGK
ncbi:hypothetical protein [Janthinobacterium sp.]|uniref:gp53-like domain-containing protein n=1 Tax=Janthinobacterium sp. TaxID=1871054 RepID=UPI00293D96B0|nr:hypothetical protein [Janthinobacterium sp.]